MSRGTQIVTADGVVAHLGEHVWRVRSYGYPTRVKLTSHNIGWIHERYFASKDVASRAALADAQSDLKKAQQSARTAKKRIARLRAEIGGARV